METLSMVDYALAYARLGIPVLPIQPVNGDGVCTCYKGSNCSDTGKHPVFQLATHGKDSATTKPAQIKAWWRKVPEANIGGVGGSFLWLDVDVSGEVNGQEKLKELVAVHGPLPSTAVVETGETPEGKRGMHYIFRVPEGKERSSGKWVGGDIKCTGGYCLLPPSTHRSGVLYEWMSPEDVPTLDDFAEVPEWVLMLAKETVEKNTEWGQRRGWTPSRINRDFVAGNHQVPLGQQTEFLPRCARSWLTQYGRTVDEVTDLLLYGEYGDGGLAACDQNPDDPWSYERVHEIVQTVWDSPPPVWGSSNREEDSFKDQEVSTQETTKRDDGRNDEMWDDMGNGHRLVSLYEEGHLIHIEEWKKFCYWDSEDKTWRVDLGTNLRARWDLWTQRQLTSIVVDSDDKPWFNFLKKSRDRKSTENALFFARDWANRKQDILDTHDFLLNCRNGVLDLRTGELLDPDPKFLLTKQIRANYTGERSDVWERVIKELIPDDEMRAFVQKCFGYALTGLTEEHKFFFFHGPPGGGKTTIVDSIAWLMGNYSETCEPSTFMVSGTGSTSGSGPSEDIARLSKARLVVAHEIERGSRWAAAKLSHLTGGDTVTARFLHQNSFEFKPKFKLFFTGNHRPRTGGGQNSGLWRRMILIPIDNVIPEKERDPMLQMRTLRTSNALAGILTWMVEGCLEWIKDNQEGKLMEVPGEIRERVIEYEREEDVVGLFLAENIVRSRDRWARVERTVLYARYVRWCEKNGRGKMNSSHFYSDVRDHSFMQVDGQVKAGDPRTAMYFNKMKLIELQRGK